MSNLLPHKKWTTCPISCLCDTDGSIQTGPFGTQLHASDYVPFGVPCIMPQDIIGGRVLTEKIAYISEENANRLSAFRLLPNDIIYPRRGDIAKHALITSKEKGWLCGTGCLRIRLNKSGILPKYLYYYLTLPHVREWIIQNSVGATMPHLNTSLVGQISVSYPTYDEQQVIISILGSLDDKIELNRRMNETLEAMARELFRDWFVDFGPTRAKMAGEAPYLAPELWELFPDRLDDEGKPEGWKITRIGDCIERLKVGTLYSQKDLELSGTVPVLDQGKNGIIGYHNNAPNIVATPNERVCTFANHTCTQKLIDFPFSTIQNVIPFKGKKFSSEWIFFATLGKQNFQEYKGHWPDFIEQTICTPDKSDVVNFYRNMIDPMLNKQSENTREIETLTQLRDLLLPKLMSGEISIRDAEKMVEDAA